MMDHLPGWLRQHIAALRMLIVFTALLGVAYPLLVTGIGQLPGLRNKANGSYVQTADGRTVGSALLGQSFKNNPKYFQSRPSIGNYDAKASGASNLGPEDIVDAPGKPSLLTQVCQRSLEIGKFNGVSGSRPYCTKSGVGAVLSVIRQNGRVVRVLSVNQPCPAIPFIRTYDGVPVQCGTPDYRRGVLVPIRGNAPAHPAVPADAVTASGSGLDPDISPAYADIQIDRVAHARELSVATVRDLVRKYTTGRSLGIIGEPAVNVLELNIALDDLRHQSQYHS